MSEKGSVTIKQTGSLAGDARVDYEIDRERKEVVIKMFNSRGKPFVSRTALEVFLTRILPNDHGVIAYHQDDPKHITDWSAYLDVEEHRFRVEVIKQSAINDYAIEIVLYPQGPGAQAKAIP